MTFMPMSCSNVEVGTLGCQWAERIRNIALEAQKEGRPMTEGEMSELSEHLESLCRLAEINPAIADIHRVASQVIMD